MSAPDPDLVVATARSWLGTPYQHQMSCKGAGCDCLGILRGVWREVIGAEPVAIPPYSYDWSEASGQEVLWDAARDLLVECAQDAPEVPGQVLLFRMRKGAVAKHLGILAQVGQAASFVHAYSKHGVVETSFSTPWRRAVVARFTFPSNA